MANFRGNKYSQKHVTLDPKTDWSYWDNAIMRDHAIYDMPAFIDYITNYSNVSSVTTISHSLSTTVMFYCIANDKNDYYKEKVNLCLTIAPTPKIDTCNPLYFAIINLWHYC